MMDAATVDTLREINRRFYRTAGAAFSATRQAPWPGWNRVADLAAARRRAKGTLRVLDVGCGNGRFARFLGKRLTAPFEFVGVDACESLLAEARRELPGSWRLRDVMQPTWDESLGADFDLIVVFGLLHHVPAARHREALLQSLATKLRPGGALAVTIWRFGVGDRFRGKRIEWSSYNRSAATPVRIADLEPGDQLLPFGPEEGLPRYCHFLDDRETDALIDALPLHRIESYLADGRTSDLNRYVILKRPECAAS